MGVKFYQMPKLQKNCFIVHVKSKGIKKRLSQNGEKSRAVSFVVSKNYRIFFGVVLVHYAVDFLKNILCIGI